MEKFNITFAQYAAATDVIGKMREIIKEYGQVSVADLYALTGVYSCYTDNNYGWKDLNQSLLVCDCKKREYKLELPNPEPLEKKCVDKGKECTDERCTENRYGYHCPHCQSLNIREVSGYHEEGAPYGTIGYECTDCHTTFTVDVFDEAALKQENERLKQELEETKNRLKESNDKLTRISTDTARLCPIMDGFGEMLNDQFIVHCTNRNHKYFIYKTVFKYSDFKN